MSESLETVIRDAINKANGDFTEEFIYQYGPWITTHRVSYGAEISAIHRVKNRVSQLFSLMSYGADVVTMLRATNSKHTIISHCVTVNKNVQTSDVFNSDIKELFKTATDAILSSLDHLGNPSIESAITSYAPVDSYNSLIRKKYITDLSIIDEFAKIKDNDVTSYNSMIDAILSENLLEIISNASLTYTGDQSSLNNIGNFLFSDVSKKYPKSAVYYYIAASMYFHIPYNETASFISTVTLVPGAITSDHDLVDIVNDLTRYISTDSLPEDMIHDNSSNNKSLSDIISDSELEMMEHMSLNYDKLTHLIEKDDALKRSNIATNAALVAIGREGLISETIYCDDDLSIIKLKDGTYVAPCMNVVTLRPYCVVLKSDTSSNPHVVSLLNFITSVT